MAIDVMLVDDFPLVRDALALGIDDDPRTRVVAAVGTGHELLDALVMQPCDVAVVDVYLPDLDGLELIRRVRRLHRETRVLVLTASERQATVREAMRAGASGYVVKRQPLDDIVDAICTVHAGGTVLAPQVAASVLPTLSASGDRWDGGAAGALDPVELDVLRLVVRGATDLQIARELYVSPRTVQYQLASIRRKAGVDRRTELARWALENSLV